MVLKGLIRKNVGSLLDEANALRDNKEWSRAAAAYQSYLDRHPHEASIWVQLGHALKEAGDAKAAEAAYRRSLRLKPEEADTHLQLGHALKLQGNASEAIEAYVAALRLNPQCPHSQHELRLAGWSAEDIVQILADPQPIGGAGGTDDRPFLASRLTQATAEGAEGAHTSFDASSYRRIFADVDLLVRLGVVDSAEQHYIHYGKRQGRDVLATLATTPPSRVFVLCPSFFKRCGIGEHARYLADSIARSGLETHRIRSTRELLQRPKSELEDAVLIVNHGPGLFDGYNPELSEGETTADLLTTLYGLFKSHNLRPIMFMHSLLDRDNEVMFPRQQFALEFPIPVATTIEAAARTFNIFRVEHGMQPMVVPPRRAKGDDHPRDYPTIGFFGFFQWGGKNFDALFHLAQALKAKLVGSVATRDAEQVEKLRSMLKEKSIVCDIGTGWVDDSELARRLVEADFHYLPQHDYDHWNNSGTARFVMNFGRPVLVPPHNPFLDLRDWAIFAEEHDLPAIVAWMRDDRAYEAACVRTRSYAQRHPMLEEMPRLATALHETASESGAKNFIDENLFCAYRLLQVRPDVFNARVQYALTAAKVSADVTIIPGEPNSAERVEAINTARSITASALRMDVPAVEAVQYWRDHYEVAEFVGLNVTDTCFAAYRRILKRDPSFADFRAVHQMLRIPQGSTARPTARHVCALLATLLSRRHDLEFAPAVQLYHKGAPVLAGMLTGGTLADELEATHRLTVERLSELTVETEARFGALSDDNLFALLMLQGLPLEKALASACQRAGVTADFNGVGARDTVLSRFLEIGMRLGAVGLRPTDVFIMDEPVPSPVMSARAAYYVAELWPYEGDTFIINLVRCLLKREPTTEEMFALAAALEKGGKPAAIEMLKNRGNLNARLIDGTDKQAVAMLNGQKGQLDPLIRQFRSPIAGGWQRRNAYLETKRNLGRQWLRLKQQKDIWWLQSGQSVAAIVG